MIFDKNGIHLGDIIAWFWRSSAYWNILIAILIGVVIYLLWLASRQEHWKNAARQVRSNWLAIVSLFILLIYIAIGLLDSIRWRDASVDSDGKLMRNEDGAIIYEPRALSLLDRITTPLRERAEKTYSAPLAIRLYSKETMTLPDGRIVRDYPRLKYGGANLKNGQNRWIDLSRRILMGLLVGLGARLAIGGTLYGKSWGNMISTARMELAREPVVWWNLAAAFVFMFGLVLPANLFGDAVRDALDPRLRAE